MSKFTRLFAPALLLSLGLGGALPASAATAQHPQGQVHAPVHAAPAHVQKQPVRHAANHYRNIRKGAHHTACNERGHDRHNTRHDTHHDARGDHRHGSNRDAPNNNAPNNNGRRG